jgi:co-chaperonin GroES (HSP10)
MIQVGKFTPWKNRFLLKPLPRKGKIGEIIVADTVTIEGEEAEVIAIGSEVTEGKVGDIVMYATGAGWGLEVDGVKMRVVPQESIEGVVG